MADERITTKKANSGKTLGKLLTYAKPYRALLAAAMLFALISVAASCSSPSQR